jgi:hypothetical protein
VGNSFWWSPDGGRRRTWLASKDGGGGFWSSPWRRLEWGGGELGAGIGTMMNGVHLDAFYRFQEGGEVVAVSMAGGCFFTAFNAVVFRRESDRVGVGCGRG